MRCTLPLKSLLDPRLISLPWTMVGVVVVAAVNEQRWGKMAVVVVEKEEETGERANRLLF